MATSRRTATVLWLALVLFVLPVFQGKPGIYKNRFNKTCRYAARNISAALFKNGIDDGFDFVAPLESGMVVNRYEVPWQACFGPGETIDIKLLQTGQKLPCFYKINKWGKYDYWEENACDILIRSNCYCYAIGKYVNSYCEPGLGTTGKSFPLPIKDCYNAVQGVLTDGGRMVDRWTVYNRPPVTVADTYHYIALAIKPAAGEYDTGDFHFWKYDHKDQSWSYKAGDTLSRNTYRNGTKLRDLDAPGARGQYSTFCGYFQVWPDSHRLTGNGYYVSNLPARFKQWRDMALRGSVVTLSRISPGWLAAYRGYYADAGWEDGVFHYQRKEYATVANHPHTYSARPFKFAAKNSTDARAVAVGLGAVEAGEKPKLNSTSMTAATDAVHRAASNITRQLPSASPSVTIMQGPAGVLLKRASNSTAQQPITTPLSTSVAKNTTGPSQTLHAGRGVTVSVVDAVTSTGGLNATKLVGVSNTTAALVTAGKNGSAVVLGASNGTEDSAVVPDANNGTESDGEHAIMYDEDLADSSIYNDTDTQLDGSSPAAAFQPLVAPQPAGDLANVSNPNITDTAGIYYYDEPYDNQTSAAEQVATPTQQGT